jgi:hypothetical protein
MNVYMYIYIFLNVLLDFHLDECVLFVTCSTVLGEMYRLTMFSGWVINDNRKSKAIPVTGRGGL